MNRLFMPSFILGWVGVITNFSNAISSKHLKLGTSLKKHPFLEELPEVQYKPFESSEEKGFSLRLQHTNSKKLLKSDQSDQSTNPRHKQALSNYDNYIYTGSIFMGRGNFK